MTKTQDFYDYVLSFYGKGGIYELEAPCNVIYVACCLVAQRKDVPFNGDTVDRESVRDILARFGYGHKKKRAAWLDSDIEQRDLPISISKA